MVDRFHGDEVRTPATGSGRSAGTPTPNNFCGGKIKGITRQPDYIAGLGCTAIWLSPVFENNPGAYHGRRTTEGAGSPRFVRIVVRREGEQASYQGTIGVAGFYNG